MSARASRAALIDGLDVGRLDAVVGDRPDQALRVLDHLHAACRERVQELGPTPDHPGPALGVVRPRCRVHAEQHEIRVDPRGSSRVMPGIDASASASRRAFAWSSASRAIIPSGPSCSATSPAAANTPAWRIPPPSSFRARRARWMNSASPTISDPTGQPSDFDRQNVADAPRARGHGPARPARRTR